jgi:hypothetical protein
LWSFEYQSGKTADNNAIIGIKKIVKHSKFQKFCKFLPFYQRNIGGYSPPSPSSGSPALNIKMANQLTIMVLLVSIMLLLDFQGFICF